MPQAPSFASFTDVRRPTTGSGKLPSKFTESLQIDTQTTDSCATKAHGPRSQHVLRTSMWCKSCAQDVPALPLRQAAGYACARCGAVLESECSTAGASTQVAPGPQVAAQRAGATATASAASDLSAAIDQAVEGLATSQANLRDRWIEAASTATPGTTLIDWQFEDALRDVEATLRRRTGAVAARRPLRVDSRHSSAPAWNAGQPARSRTSDPSAPQPRRASIPVASGGWLAWLLLWPGMTALVCGSVLLVASIVQKRDELWEVGLPVTLVGQGAIFFGVALLVERLWSQRRTAERQAVEDDPPLHADFDSAPVRRKVASGRRRPNGSHRRPATLSESFHNDASQLLADLQDRLNQLAERL